MPGNAVDLSAIGAVPGEQQVDLESLGAVAAPEGPGDFKRGATVALKQIPQLAKGALAGAGMAIEQSPYNAFDVGGKLKQYGLEGYKADSENISEIAKPTDEFTTVLDRFKSGDTKGAIGDLIDYLQYQTGYFGGQALATAATGGAGAVAGSLFKKAMPQLLGSLVEREAIRMATEKLGAGATQQAIQEVAPKFADAAARRLSAEIGATGALAGYNTMQEAGQIFPAAQEQADLEGRQLTQQDLAKAAGFTGASAGTETIADLIPIAMMLGRINLGGKGGTLARALTAGAANAGIQGGQEGVQTYLERAGAGQPLQGPEFQKDVFESTVAPMFPSFLLGGAGGAVIRPRTDATPPPARGTPNETPIAAPTPAVPPPAVPGEHVGATSDLTETPKPTAEQIAAGNYKLDKAKLGDFNISIENRDGTLRGSTTEGGEPWTRAMVGDYGYFTGVPARSPDKEHVDVLIAPNTPRDYNGPAFVIDQKQDNGDFDEAKVIQGVRNPEDALSLYLKNYPATWKNVSGITRMSQDELGASLQNKGAFMQEQGNAAPVSFKTWKRPGNFVVRDGAGYSVTQPEVDPNAKRDAMNKKLVSLLNDKLHGYWKSHFGEDLKGTIVPSAFSSPAQEMVDHLLSPLFKVTVVPVRSKVPGQALEAHGFRVMDAPHTVFVNTDSTPAEMFSAVAMHEITHDMQRRAPAVYDQMSKALADLGDLSKFKLGAHKDVAAMTDEAARHEFNADIVGDQATSPEFWGKLRDNMKDRPGLFLRIAKFIRDRLDGLLGYLGSRGFGSSSYLKDAQKVRDAVAKSMADYVNELRKPQEVTNAVREQGTAQGVPSEKGPELGLPQVGEGNAEPQVAPAGAEAPATQEQEPQPRTVEQAPAEVPEQPAPAEPATAEEPVAAPTPAEPAQTPAAPTPIEDIPAPEPEPERAPSKEEESASSTVAKYVAAELKAGRKITWQELFSEADKAFGGTQAQGKYSPKDAYDAMEMGVNMHIRNDWNLFGLGVASAEEVANAAQNLTTSVMDKIPTQTRRDQETNEFQQFSTPPPLSLVANWVAAILPGDVVIEPSAGNGGLAIISEAFGAKLVLNEYSPRRAANLRTLFPKAEVFTENAEQLNNVLPDDVKPTTVVMNPPFSATAGRVEGQRNTMNGARHIEQALDRLEQGGRLVAIVGEGMAIDRPAFRQWWRNITSQYNVRANVGVSGDDYAKYGTTFDNQILVIDKNGPTIGPIVTGKVERFTELPALLGAIRDDRSRPETEASKPLPDQSGSEELPGQDELGSRPDITLRPATDDVGNAGGGGVGPGAQQPRRDGDTGTAGAIGPRGPDTGAPSGDNVAGRGGPDNSEPVAVGGDIGGGGDNAPGISPVESGARLKQGGLSGEPEKTEFSSAIFEPYRPAKVHIEGAQPHKGVLVESAAMASVEPPDPTYVPNLPSELITSGNLSAAQLESIVYAGQAHEQFLPNGERRGFMIGDGTGVGKGREIAGIILDNMRRGRDRAVWMSATPGLMNDAGRDLEDIGVNKNLLIEKPAASKEITAKKGILFMTYDTLKSGSQTKTKGTKVEAKSRLDQLVDWLGKDFDGPLILDEAHLLGNALDKKGSRGVSKASQRALAAVDLQKALPNARVVYVSATAATEIENLAYATRLGLWGEGTAFPDVRTFIERVSSGGVAAMELISRDMKSLGMMLSRGLSFHDVQQESVVHEITPLQRDIYNRLTDAWQVVLNNISAALASTGQANNPKAKSAAMSRFWGTHLRFFNQILTAMQTPTLIEKARERLDQGESVVIQLVNTNEAEQNRQINKAETEGIPLDELDFTPRESLLSYVQNAFPIQEFVAQTDDNGNVVYVPAVDSKGNPIINKKAVEERDKLLSDLQHIRVPGNPLDEIIAAFGTENVAEVTGRSRRFIKKADEEGRMRMVEERRTEKSVDDDAASFLADRKKVLIFSGKGGTGFSFQAGLRFKNQRMRNHFALQLGWRADQVMQGFGRSHRSNQKQAPKYWMVSTDLKAQKRFVSSVARRLDQLGAITKGQRETTSQGMIAPEDNLENKYASAAVQDFFFDLFRGNVEGMDFSETTSAMGFSNMLNEDTGQLNVSKIPSVQQFLNRMLSLNTSMQDDIFEQFFERLKSTVEEAKQQGTYDAGMQTVEAPSIRKVSDRVVYTDERTGAKTRYLQLDIDDPIKFNQFSAARDYLSPVRVHKPNGIKGYFQNLKNGKVFAAREIGDKVDGQGNVERRVFAIGTVDSGWSHPIQNPEELERGFREKWSGGTLKRIQLYRKLEEAEAEELWNKQVDESPKVKTRRAHMIVGVILPIWNRVYGHPRIYRLRTDGGERLLGRFMNQAAATQTLKALGVGSEATQIPISEQVALIKAGRVALLSNGWELKSATVSGDKRLEVTTRYFSRPEIKMLESQGAFVEVKDWRERVFIPYDDLNVVKRVTNGNPIVEITDPNATPDSGSSAAGDDVGGDVQFSRTAVDSSPLVMFPMVNGAFTFQNRTIELSNPTLHAYDANGTVYTFDVKNKSTDEQVGQVNAVVKDGRISKLEDAEVMSPWNDILKASIEASNGNKHKSFGGSVALDVSQGVERQGWDYRRTPGAKIGATLGWFKPGWGSSPSGSYSYGGQRNGFGEAPAEAGTQNEAVFSPAGTDNRVGIIQEERVAALAEDLDAQTQWLTGIAGQRGFSNLDEMFSERPEETMALMASWRDEHPDVQFSRTVQKTMDVANASRYIKTMFESAPSFKNSMIDLFKKSPHVMSAWSALNTPYHIAETHPEFRPLFDETQQMLSDISSFANEAADMAPLIVPRVSSMMDVLPESMGGIKAPSAEDMEAVSHALSEGTLYGGGNPTEGVIWTEDELRGHESALRPLPAKFNLSDDQIRMYQQYLSAVATSLETLGKSLLVRRSNQMNVRTDPNGSMETVADQAVEYAKQKIEEINLAMEFIRNEMEPGADQQRRIAVAEENIRQWRNFIYDINSIKAKTTKLILRGYVPLMRFGKYGVSAHVEDENGNARLVYFGRFETKPEYLLARRAVSQAYPDASVTGSVMNDEAHKLFEGMNLHALELFAEHVILDDGRRLADDPVMQQFYSLATTERSTMKRLIHRKGTPGFSTDAGRVLAQFITSNSRAASANYHSSNMLRLASKLDGDLGAYATRYVRYVQDPQEEAPRLRSFLSSWFILGSPAAAAVNMTQPVMITAPYLSQYVGIARAARTVAGAAKDFAFRQIPAADRADLERAQSEGHVSPQEIHQLLAESRGSVFGRNLKWRKLMFAWSSFYAMAEQFNRGTTFLAALRIARDTGMRNPYQFAVKAVNDTQFVYNRGSRPEISRGAIGATLMTFKQFTISYIELAKRMASLKDKRPFAIMMMTLFAAAGVEGLPFAEDIEDIIDTIGQWLGYGTNSKRAMRELAVSILGPDIADMLLHGMPSALPVDLSMRLGMQNLVPGTGILKTSSRDWTKDAVEFFGPAGSVFQSARYAISDAADNNWKGALQSVLPKAARDISKAADMVLTGEYLDNQGAKVTDATLADAAIKFLGFQPRSVADRQRAKFELAQDIALQKVVEDSITRQWAEGISEGDQGKVDDARRRMLGWNLRNPEIPVKITPKQIKSRVKNLTRDVAERQLASTPKEMRPRAREVVGL